MPAGREGKAPVLGIDWGSSNRRAYLLDAGGVCLRRMHDRHGALAARGHFPAELAAVRTRLNVDAGVQVIMAGMVGGMQGWQEVSYLDTSIPLDELPGRLVPVEGAPGCFIVPGYCHRETGTVDTMRGEETQLLGALMLEGGLAHRRGGDGSSGRSDSHGGGEGHGVYDVGQARWFVLPGTHSKWVQLRSGCILGLSTYLTGELFAALAAGGTLAPLMAQGAGEDDLDALDAGARRAQHSPALSHALFEARARVVAGGQPARQTRDYVSGILIGAEFVAQRHLLNAAQPITLLGAPALCMRYARIAHQFGLNTRLIDPDRAFCAALAHLKEGLP